MHLMCYTDIIIIIVFWWAVEGWNMFRCLATWVNFFRFLDTFVQDNCHCLDFLAVAVQHRRTQTCTCRSHQKQLFVLFLEDEVLVQLSWYWKHLEYWVRLHQRIKVGCNSHTGLSYVKPFDKYLHLLHQLTTTKCNYGCVYTVT